MQYARRLQAPYDPDDANDDKGGTSGPNDTCRKYVQIILALQHSALTDRTLQICLKRTAQIATAQQSETKRGSTWIRLAPTAGITPSQRISTATSDNERGNQLSEFAQSAGEKQALNDSHEG